MWNSCGNYNLIAAKLKLFCNYFWLCLRNPWLVLSPKANSAACGQRTLWVYCLQLRATKTKNRQSVVGICMSRSCFVTAREPCLKIEIGISSIYSLHYLLATTLRAFSLSEFILSYAYLKFISYSRFKNIAKPFSRTCTWQPCQVSIVHALCWHFSCRAEQRVCVCVCV